MTKELEAPIGSKWSIEWTTDPHVNLTNRFKLITGAFKEIAGRKAKPSKNPKKQVVDLTVTLTVTLDGQDNGFREDMPDPEQFLVQQFGLVKEHGYRSYFLARTEGVYEFTIDLPGRDPQTIVKKIKVTPEIPLNDRRKDLIALFDKWMPDSVIAAPKIPPGEKKNLLALSGWNTTSDLTWDIPPTDLPGCPSAPELPKKAGEAWEQSGATIKAKGEGQRSAAKRSFNDNFMEQRKASWKALSQEEKAKRPKLQATNGPVNIPIVTSCGDVAAALIKLWSNNQSHVKIGDQRKHAGYVIAKDAYAENPPRQPKPGDIVYINNPKTNYFAHMCILKSRSDDVWVTADGGGGRTPEQTARVVDKKIEWTKGAAGPPAVPQLPMFLSVTDNQMKVLDGWIDLDLVPNDLYNADGSKK